MFHLLNTTLTLDDLYDMLEARAVWQSWSHADKWDRKNEEHRG